MNLLTAWRHEIMEMMGGHGINSIEALRGNRLMLRGVGLTSAELSILGIAHAGAIRGFSQMRLFSRGAFCRSKIVTIP